MPFSSSSSPVHQAADDRRVETFGGQHVIRRSAPDAALGQRPVHAPDDVAAFAKFAHRLGLVVDHPLAGADLLGQAERLQLAQPPDRRVEFVGLLARCGARSMMPVRRLSRTSWRSSCVQRSERSGSRAAPDIEVGARSSSWVIRSRADRACPP